MHRRVLSILQKKFLNFVVLCKTSATFVNSGYDKLVEVLDTGGYVRCDFSTATNLLEIAKKLCLKEEVLKEASLESHLVRLNLEL